MDKKNHVLSLGYFYFIALSFCIFLSLFQSAATGEELRDNANDFRVALEAAGWKPVLGPDGAMYLYPPAHPYAHLGHHSGSEWNDIPPPGSKPLSAIVHMLEWQGYTPMVEIEYEDGGWEIEAYRYGKLVEFAMDPVSGKTSALPSEDTE